MDSSLEESEIQAIYGDDYVDITDEVICYDKGKVFACECGQDFGVTFDETALKCPTCGRMVVDKKVDERGPPKREKGQTGLGDWV